MRCWAKPLEHGAVCDAGHRGGRHLVAIPLRQIRLDHLLLAALRVTTVAIGSPMFHFGILVVVAGHVIGLLIPSPGPPQSG